MEVREGKVEGGGLLKALRSIAAGKLEGLLAVQSDQDLVSVTFVEGRIVAVDAMNRPMEEALSEVLAARGLVAPQNFAATVDPILGTGRLAGDVLLEAQLLERDQLLDAVREQVCEQALQLLRWERGVFSWSSGAESPYQEGMEPLGVAELIVLAREQQGDSSASGAWSVDLGDHFAAAGRSSALVLGTDADWIEDDDEREWLTPVEKQVLDSIAPSQPASYLLLQLGVDSYELRYAIQVLLELEHLRRVGEALPETTPGGVRDLLGAEGDISELLEAPPELDSGADLSAMEINRDLDPEAPVVDEPPSRESSDFDLRSSLFADDEAEQLQRFEDHDEWTERLAREQSFWRTSLKSLTERFKSNPAGPSKATQRPESVAQVLSVWAARIMALGFAVLLASQVFYRGQRHHLEFPFFWQTGASEQMETRLWDASSTKIGDALRAYHLLYGRFPDDLEILVDLNLLAPSNLYDSRGRWLAYAATDAGYRLLPAEGEQTMGRLERRGVIENDVFLDPRFVLQLEAEEEPELRVMD